MRIRPEFPDSRQWKSQIYFFNVIGFLQLNNRSKKKIGRIRTKRLRSILILINPFLNHILINLNAFVFIFVYKKRNNSFKIIFPQKRSYPMRKAIFIRGIIAFAFLSFLFSSVGWSQRHPRRPMFNNKQIKKYVGKIVKIEEISSVRRRPVFVVIHVKVTSGKIIPFRVAPQTFLQEKKIVFMKGQPVTIFAAKRTFRDRTLYFTQRVLVKGKEWRLRSKDGFPLWRKRRPRR